MHNVLKIGLLVVVSAGLPGCAALWVADKTVDAAWFATKTTAKAGAGAAELTWDAGSAAVGAATGGEDDPAGEKEPRDDRKSGQSGD